MGSILLTVTKITPFLRAERADFIPLMSSGATRVGLEPSFNLITECADRMTPCITIT